MQFKPITIKESQVKNQTRAVLWHLGSKGTITSWEAIQQYGATRLAAIIFCLRQEGYSIVSIPEKKTNRFGGITTIAKYKYLPPTSTSGNQMALNLTPNKD